MVGFSKFLGWIVATAALVGCGGFQAKQKTRASVANTSQASPTPYPVATPAPVPAPAPTAAPTAAPLPDQVADFRVLTLNMKGIPCLAESALSGLGSLFGVKKCPLVNDWYTQHNTARFVELANKINELRNVGREPDVVLLQEVFTARNDIFDDSAALLIPQWLGYGSHIRGSESRIANGMSDYWNLLNQNRSSLRGLLNAGTMILAKHAMSEQNQIDYTDLCAIDDCHANKGAAHARVYLGVLDIYIDVVTTHVQAGSAYDAIRSAQSDVLTSFAQAHAGGAVGIVGGDLNSRLPFNSDSMNKIRDRLGVRHAGAECVGSASCEKLGDTGQLGGNSLDHIYVKGNAQVRVDVVRGEVFSWTYAGLPLSDHSAQLIELRLTKKR